jgi:hypothetical protein
MRKRGQDEAPCACGRTLRRRCACKESGLAEIEARIGAFLGEYSPGIATELEGARARLRALFPRGFELVFNNYNALVFAYSPTPKSSQCLLSVAGYPRWINLFFAAGVALPDPTARLQGSGKAIRSVRLTAARVLDEPDVRALLAAAIGRAEKSLAAAPALTTVLKGIAATRRARRPPPAGAATAPLASPRRRPGRGR